MSDRTIIGGVTRMAKMLVTAENQLAQYRSNFERFMAVQEDQLAQLRVAMDDAAVMLGIIPQSGSVPPADTIYALPAGPPQNPGSGPQVTFTPAPAVNDGNGSGHPNNFQGVDQ